MDCAARTGVGRGLVAPSPPAPSPSTGPQGAPALRACPQASNALGPWLETAARSPHFLLPLISISSIRPRPTAGPRRALRCGSRFVQSFLKVFPPPGGPGKWGADQKVLVSPLWAEKISWAERNVYMDMSRQSIKESPQWASPKEIDRAYETNLYNYYGRPMYWSLGQLPEEEESPHHAGADTK